MGVPTLAGLTGRGSMPGRRAGIDSADAGGRNPLGLATGATGTVSVAVYLPAGDFDSRRERKDLCE